ncbi:hypothetical protein HPB50_016177 [Hyalomma asiaticum]|uniref:Uncharacterized protein n=1 Tax=Hyalomma asiaticum TaxID=266040 RepID=A0ACB7TL30_HYAAI|nr:hypothetical protein HPB50_016177 [Hyalomma asiaticum]
MSDVAIEDGGDASEVLNGLKADGGDSSSADSFEPMTVSSLKCQVFMEYGPHPKKLVSSFFRAIFNLSAYANKAAFLDRCRCKGVVPTKYRVKCPDIKNTGNVVQILDKCSYKLMLADLDYSRRRKAQVRRQLELLHEKLAKVLSSKDLQNVLAFSKAKYEKVFEATREKLRAKFAELLEEYEIKGKDEEDDK